MLPTPFKWLSTPVSNIERVGEQDALTWKLEKRMPFCANWLRWGVCISPPNAPTSLKPQSSANMTTMLGRLAKALVQMMHIRADKVTPHALLKREQNIMLMKLWNYLTCRARHFQ